MKKILSLILFTITIVNAQTIVSTSDGVPLVVQTTAYGTPVNTTIIVDRPVTRIVNSNSVVATYKDTTTTVTTPVTITTVTTPVTIDRYSDDTTVTVNGTPVTTYVFQSSITNNMVSSLYSTATTQTNVAVISTNSGTPVTTTSIALRTDNTIKANGNTLASTYVDTTTTVTTPIIATTVTTPVTTTIYAAGTTVITLDNSVTATSPTHNEVAISTVSDLKETVEKSVTTGTIITSTSVTKGTETFTSSTAFNKVSEDKRIKITKVVTTKTEAPVTTVTTVTTPVTTTITTTPVVNGVYGTVASTSSVSNTATSSTVVTKESSTSLQNTDYFTRVDQLSYLNKISGLINASVDNNALDRHYGGESTEFKATTYFGINKSGSNTTDTYKYKGDHYSLGGERYLGNNIMIGAQYDYITGTVAGEQSGGTLVKHHLGLFNLYSTHGWIVDTDVGAAVNTFTNYHTLNELALTNSGTTKGKDVWGNLKVYTPDLVGLRLFAAGRYEGNTVDAEQEIGSALTTILYDAIDTREFTKQIGIRFDRLIGTNLRLIGEASIYHPSTNTRMFRAGLMYFSSSKHFNGSINIIQQRAGSEGIILNTGRLELNVKF